MFLADAASRVGYAVGVARSARQAANPITGRRPGPLPAGGLGPLPASWNSGPRAAVTVDSARARTYAAFCSSKLSPVAPELGTRLNRAAGDRFARAERGSALDSLRWTLCVEVGIMEGTGHSPQFTGTAGTAH
jgi:hypothetical protein